MAPPIRALLPKNTAGVEVGDWCLAAGRQRNRAGGARSRIRLSSAVQRGSSPHCHAAMSIPTDADLNAQSAAPGAPSRPSLQLVTAESCSGGDRAAMTDIAGSSAFFDCAWWSTATKLSSARYACARRPWSSSVRSAAKPCWKWSPARWSIPCRHRRGGDRHCRPWWREPDKPVGRLRLASAVAAMPAPSCSSLMAIAKPSAGKPWRRYCAVSTPAVTCCSGNRPEHADETLGTVRDLG